MAAHRLLDAGQRGNEEEDGQRDLKHGTELPLQSCSPPGGLGQSCWACSISTKHRQAPVTTLETDHRGPPENSLTAQELPKLAGIPLLPH